MIKSQKTGDKVIQSALRHSFQKKLTAKLVRYKSKMLFSCLLSVTLSGSMFLSACAGGKHMPVEVTRFHTAQLVAGGSLAIMPHDPTMKNTFEYQKYSASLATILTQVGFQVVPNPQQADFILTYDVMRGTRYQNNAINAGDNRPHGGISMGGGYGSGGGGFGGGFGGGGISTGFSIPVGNGYRTSPRVETMLTAQLSRHDTHQVIWEGHAKTQAKSNAPEGNPDWAVNRLATAMFSNFPGPSGEMEKIK